LIDNPVQTTLPPSSPQVTVTTHGPLALSGQRIREGASQSLAVSTVAFITFSIPQGYQ